MICASVPLREVLAHIDTTLQQEVSEPVSGVIARGARASMALDELDDLLDLLDDASPDNVVFLLVTRRSAA